MAAPTLLVGLGGTGSKIVQRVRLLARSHHMEDNLSYVVFDTDVNELKDIRQRTPEIKVVQTSTKQTVGQYLDQDTYARDHWFPVNKILNRKTLSEGAGQVRSISRLALNTAIKTGKMNPLHEAVEQLYKLNGEASMQAMRVILVGSLCGGTGSGLILPVALYIRNYLVTRFQQNAAIIRGFFMLPEVFYEVIHGQEERNNLKANAYAALRELDAFLMLGDGSLDSRYHMEFVVPRAGSDENEEYTGSPMDFCFLYDAQNMDGNKQNSFADYLDHAASCIYAQSIAPTSKRSNSSEDNVIRELCKSGGRNRYCGAGSSMIIYPIEDVKEYLALSWLKDNVSVDWLHVDAQYRKEREATQKARRKGLSVPPMNRMRHYITTVDAGADSNRVFDASVRRQCMVMDETGTFAVGSRWEQYVLALEKYAKAAAVANRKDIAETAEACVVCQEVVASAAKDQYQQVYSDWYNKLQTYRGTAFRAAQDSAKTIAYSLFHDDSDYTRGSDDFRLETWLKDSVTGATAHPNAVRYFLYQLHFLLESRIKQEETKVRNIDSWFREFETETFDDESTEDKKEDAKDYIDLQFRDLNGIRRFTKRGAINQAKATLDEQFSEYYDQVSLYRVEYVLQEVLREAIAYVDGLCDAMHKFYSVLERKIEDVDHEMESIESRYAYTDGQPTRYVCASKKCLRGMKEEVVYMGDSMELPGGLTSMIYSRCKEYALMDKKPISDQFFLDIYDDGGDGTQLDENDDPVIGSVMAFWRSQIMAEYGDVVDMNVLAAMKKEFELERAGEGYDSNAWKLYAEKIIDAANILSNPFIERPLGVEPRTIPASCYSVDLTENASAEQRAFVEKQLGNRGGVADESIDKHMIVFYQAIYGLRANNLSKFAPPKTAQTYDRAGGEYYTAYFELISQLNPDTTKSLAITPHIDRNWHVISALPDLDENSERDQEYSIQAAMFWGLITGTIRFVDDKKRELYSLRFEDGTSDEMVVSNGTPCDNLYEVLDSLTISPLNVARIHRQIQKVIRQERNIKKPIYSALLRRKLDNFELPEFPRPEGTDPTRTIFDIALLMQKSKPVDEYQVDEIRRLMITIFGEIKQYLTGFMTGDDLSDYYGRLIYNQFKLFLSHLVEERDMSIANFRAETEEAKQNGTPLPEYVPEWLNIYNDDLFQALIRMTQTELVDCFMSDEAEEIEQDCKVLEIRRKR